MTYAGKLYALPPAQELINQSLPWQLDTKECVLPGNGCLRLISSVSVPAMSIDRLRMKDVQIRYRQGGEELKLPGRPTKSLKKLLQEAAIEPWLREQLPLIYIAEQLAFVPGIGVAENYSVSPSDESAFTVEWVQQNFNWPSNEKSN
jgi:tRNA(Ile)-lysidine synthase